MPVLGAQDRLVLLTGASGFLAVHALVQLLERGYSVRGTVRSAGKGDYLTELVRRRGLPVESWSYVIVKDIEEEGVFDEAMKGVDGVLHTASPFHYKVEDPWRDMINPAVQGTVNVLRSALREKSVKRVVITSSYASVFGDQPPVYSYTESDWNEYSPAQVAKLGKDVQPFHSYRTSKVEAEKAAWAFVKENNPSFEVTTICPPLIFGPVLHEIPTAESINVSVGNVHQFLLGNKTAADATAPNGSLVDVRDVAQLHIDSLTVPDAGGKRFLVSTTDLQYQMFLNYVHSEADLLAAFPKTLKGSPEYTPEPQNTIDTSLARSTFGWTPIPWELTIRDMALSLAEREKQWGAQR